MDIEQWWPRLDSTTRAWLVDHNGEVLSDDVVRAIERAGGPDALSAVSSWDDESGGRALDDSVVDRIEEFANAEL